MKKNSVTLAQFTYDGDGRQVKSVVNGVTTLFVGAHYHTENGVVTKYYFAGASRIAMRKNGVVSYLLSDHLGSISLTTNASGNLVSELRYKPWGETRYSSGATPTNYRYTGQREESSFGLYFYNARWYDSGLGRFTSPDTIVPQGQGVQAWDRFAYVNNNPVRYNDPSGHCAVLCVVFASAAILSTPFVLSAFGIGPDMVGVDIARAVTRGSGDAVIAASLAVQSQYPWAVVGGDARGWAQATDDELNGMNPYSPSVSIAVIEKRIELAIGVCHKCKTPTDRLIVAALAQNGPGFDADDIKDLPMNNGTINWDYVMTELGDNPSAWHAKLRQNITGMNYDTQFMLKIFMQDLKLLLSLGYQMPSEYEGADFDIINNLINSQTPVQNTPTQTIPAPNSIPSPI